MSTEQFHTAPIQNDDLAKSPDFSVWGLVLSRRGSVRLPGKALQPLLRKPMIQYAFEAAMQAGSLAKTWLFSDDPQALRLADQAGVSIPGFERPESVSASETTTLETVRYFLGQFAPQELPHWVMLLQPTSPLRTAQDIEGAVSFLKANQAQGDSLVSVTRPLKPLNWTYRLNERQQVEKLFTPQDNLVMPNGAIYLFDPRRVLAGEPLLAGQVLGYEMPWERSVDIDTIEELRWAEVLLLQSVVQRASDASCPDREDLSTCSSQIEHLSR